MSLLETYNMCVSHKLLLSSHIIALIASYLCIRGINMTILLFMAYEDTRTMDSRDHSSINTLFNPSSLNSTECIKRLHKLFLPAQNANRLPSSSLLSKVSY